MMMVVLRVVEISGFKGVAVLCARIVECMIVAFESIKFESMSV